MKFFDIVIILVLFIKVNPMNPLPNYSQINSLNKVEHLFPSTVEEVAVIKDKAFETLKKINTLINKQATNQTYADTFDVLDAIQSEAIVSAEILDVIINCHPEQQIRDNARAAYLEIHNAITNTIMLNKQLYVSLKRYADNFLPEDNLTVEQRYFINHVMDDFIRSGIQTDDVTFAKIQKTVEEITEIGTQFQNNINSESSFFLTSLEELQGTPQYVIDALEQTANGMYKINTSTAVVWGILEHCHVQEIRKKTYLQKSNVAYPQNIEVLSNLINKRDELAQLIGFPSYAALELSSEMAQDIVTVENFVNNLATPSLAKATTEIQEWLAAYPNPAELLDDNGKIYKWNIAFLKDYYKQNTLNLNASAITEYFALEHTLDQLLKVYEQFFAISFKKHKFTRWHEDVELVEVYKNGQLIAYIVLDLFSRPNKFSHAASFSVITGSKKGTERTTTVNVLMLNFQKPTKTTPSLLTMDDVTTFFHEFGHALHAALGTTTIASLSGTAVKTDFAEMPSQMLEMWLTEPEILKMVSKHYKTGKPLSDEVIAAIIKNNCYDAGHFICRQLGFTNISLQLYKEGTNKNIQEITDINEQTMRPHVANAESDHYIASFGHLYGYGAKYYGYMWSNVFAKDLFSEIKKRGILDPKVGNDYINKVIGKGGATDPNEMLEDFLGRKPTIDAFVSFMRLKPASI